MKSPRSWDEACWSVLHAYDLSNAAFGTLDELERIVSKLRPYTRNYSIVSEVSPTLLFKAIGREAVGHLKSVDEWSAEDMLSLLVSKQHDYGHDNINSFGYVGLIVRMSDKVARLRNLTRTATPHNEATLDTWRDLVGYAVIAEMLADNTFDLPLMEYAS